MLSAPRHDSNSLPEHAEPKRATVTFALSAEEQRLFFPDDVGDRCPGAMMVDVCGELRPRWREIVLEHRPRILVSGWSTPRLDPELTVVGGGPIDYVCQVSGSVRHVVTRDLIAAGLKVSNWGELVAPIVAEHALLLVLAALRNLGAWDDFMRLSTKDRKKSVIGTRALQGKRVALHGFGAIARALVPLLRPFNVAVSAFSQGVPPDLIVAHDVQPASSLVELARHCDVFVCCEALTPATRRSIDAAVLAALPDGAVFVNVGRGALVDEPALLATMETKRLRIASDVFTTEPLPADSPFFNLRGAILSPHIGGPTHDYYAVCGDHALANIARYRRGETPQSLITLEVFDRST